MTAQPGDKPKRGFLRNLSDTFDTVRTEAKSAYDDFRVAVNTPVPPRDAPAADLLNYVETVKEYVGVDRANLTLLNGFDVNDALALGEVNGDIREPLLALCRANLDTHPDLVNQIARRLMVRNWAYEHTT